MENRLTLVIGLGEVGRPLFELATDQGLRVQGLDVERAPVREPVGVMHVCYPFDVPRGFVEVTAGYARELSPELIVIHSTVRPGTTREVATRTGVPAAYSPVRGKHTRMKQELKRYTKYVAALDAATAARAHEHMASFGMQVRALATPEGLELAKLLETTYLGVLIAWAQEMDRMARAVGADYMELTRFFEEVDYLPKVAFQPGFIGGHCVIPNVELLRQQGPSVLLDAIVASNDLKAKELALAGPPAERLAPVPFPRPPAP